MADHNTTLTIASAEDREQIYRIRHQVYATELKQHAENASGALTDALDAVNTFIVAKRGDRVLGFVAITPPSSAGYSIDKYFQRCDVPVPFDTGLYEVRLLTVVERARASQLAALLMYAAFRFCESRGAHTLVAIGRLELLSVYERVGLRRLGKRMTAGAVAYELLAATIGELRRAVESYESMVQRIAKGVRFDVPGVDVSPAGPCYHGGAFFDAIGDEFDNLRRADAVISADVLDAWFPPAPSALAALAANLAFALRTSPPTHSEGLQRLIARTRGVAVDSILPGTGSSDLIFAALRTWITRDSRVLILDPMYGEYAHVLEDVIGARVDRLALQRKTQYDVDEDQLRAALQQGYDWVVLVNPNSPTGRYFDGDRLRRVLAEAPPTTKAWIDETYIDFAGGDSMESFAAASTAVVVCKSMSKAYALSGARVGYLCGPPAMMRELRALCPPWSVSLPAQIAACEALRASDYYQARWRETARLRQSLSTALETLGWTVVPGCANFLLCQLGVGGPTAAAVVQAARTRGLYLRDVRNMGHTLGDHDLRIAVKDEITNRRMVAIITEVLTRLSDAHTPADRRRVRTKPVRIHRTVGSTTSR